MNVEISKSFSSLEGKFLSNRNMFFLSQNYDAGST